jgi:hypothetical protein
VNTILLFIRAWHYSTLAVSLVITEDKSRASAWIFAGQTLPTQLTQGLAYASYDVLGFGILGVVVHQLELFNSL